MDSPLDDGATLEWFGATTYRLRTKGLTIFLDTWVERPSSLKSFLTIDQVEEADYIFISHAHFDHLPGSDRLAKKTGAVVIANGEAINVLKAAGVPETQLLPVAGGERIPLFTREARQAAAHGQGLLAPGPPGAPSVPHPSLAAMTVHAYPSLHCLLPGPSHHDIPDEMDTGHRYEGEASPYVCTLDITRGMRYGLLRLNEIVPPEHLDDKDKAFIEYISDREKHVFSHYDGGQMIFNFLIGSKTLLWNSHLGGYQGVLRDLTPKPDALILSVAGRANIDGRPFNGSAAEAGANICKWLGEPEKVIFCLHDEAPIKPYRVDIRAAKEKIEGETKSRIETLEHASVHQLF